MGEKCGMEMIKTILITGIGGSGGSYFAEYVKDNHPDTEVHGLCRWHAASSGRNLAGLIGRASIHEVDLNDFSSIYSTLKSIQPQAIVHFASHANVRSSFSNPISVMSNNVLATSNLLEAVRLVCPESKVLLISTSEVYGQVDPANIPIKETCPLNPVSPYAVSKVAQDLLGQVYWMAYKVPVVRTRMFTYINPRRSDLFATSFALQIARIEAGLQQVIKHGNLNSVRTIIDVRDAMEAYWAALDRGQSGEVYNIGGTTSEKVGDVLSDLVELSTAEYIKSRIDEALIRPSDVTLQIPDTSKFFAATGWSPKFGYFDSLHFLLDECRKQVQMGHG